MEKILAIFMCLIIATACSEEELTSNYTNSNNTTIPVQVKTVEKSTFTSFIELVGSAIPKEQIPITTQHLSQIRKIHVQNGDEVNKGTVLFSLENRLVQQQVYQLRETVRALEQVRSQLSNLNQEQLATQTQIKQMVDAAIIQIKKSNSHDSTRYNQQAVKSLNELKRITKPKSSVSAISLPFINTQLKKARLGLREATEALQATTITSPIEGTVSQISVKKGSPTLAPAPLAVVSSKGKLQARFFANKYQVKQLSKNLPVTMRFEDFSPKAKGKIQSISTEPHPKTNTYSINVSLDDNQNKIKPGLTAKAYIARNKVENAMTVPNNSLLFEEEKTYVFVVKDKYAYKKEIKIADAGKKTVHVLTGLEVGDQVVTEGKYRLTNRSKISFKK